MNKLYFLILFLFLICNAKAQTSLLFKVKQLPELQIEAGPNRTITKGEQVTLGGDKTANGGSGKYSYNWSPLKGLDKTDVANPLASPDTTTTYTLTVSDSAGRTITDVVIVTVNSVTGINTPMDEFGVTIYPNPSSGTIYITSTKEVSHAPVQLQLYDLLGKLVYSATVGDAIQKLNLVIKLSPFTKGVFNLKLTGNKMAITRKVIVQ